MSNRKRSNGSPDGINPAKRKKTLIEDEETITDTGLEIPQKCTLVTGANADENNDGEEDDDGEDDDGEDDDGEDDDDDGEDDEDYEIDYFNMEDELTKLKNSNLEAYQELKAVRLEISRTEPNIHELLSTPLRIEDKAKLCQLYEIYKSHTPETEECLDARTRYNETLKIFKADYLQHSKYSNEILEHMQKEENNFKGFSTQLELKYKILNLNTNKDTKEIIYSKYSEMMTLDHSDDEYNKLKTWLYWATNIPHNSIKKISIDNKTEFIKKAKEKLDSELYGMEKAKEQILLFLNTKLYSPSTVHSNLGLVGSPGTGKTHIARLISKIMDWGFSQISFGGTDKADFLKGHEYTYVGAQPGEIVKSLKRIGHKNGVIFLDELDKISESPDIRSALLHLIDPTQNTDFRDMFLNDISIDLSQIWWIGSMNNVPQDIALADRWWIVNIEGYTHTDKIQIIKEHLLPKALKNCDLDKNLITFNEGVISILISKICDSHDKGVRTLEKAIKDLVNKISFILSHQDINGKLPFKTSFELNTYLQTPVKINKDLLETIMESKELTIMGLKMMYV